MEYGVSTRLFADRRLGSHILDSILAAGFRELEVFAARQHLNYCDTNHVRDLAPWFEDHGIALYSVHAPLFADEDWGRLGGLPVSVAYRERRLRIESMDEIKRALEIAERLPFRYLILHLGLPEESYDLRKFDAAFTSIEHLKIFAKERGVQLLIENTPNELSTPERLTEFLNYTRLDDVKICFDTGHAHLGGGVREAFRALKGRIACAHLHDNHRHQDEHLVPYEGDINWDEVVRDFRGLSTADGRFPVLFEIKAGKPEASVLPRLQQVVERINSVAAREEG